MERRINGAYKIEMRAQWYDCDRENILFFGNVFKYVTAAEEDYIRSINLTHDILKEKYNIGFFRVKAECSYKKPIVYGDLIEIHLRCKIEKKSFLIYNFKFYRKNEQVLLVKGSVKTAACAMIEQKLKITEIPGKLIARFTNG
jgi:YbgC/YbaW family acyl-CoA thioester hydrolase